MRTSIVFFAGLFSFPIIFALTAIVNYYQKHQENLRKQVIRVQKLVGLPPPHSNYLASLLGLEEPSLKLLCSSKLQRTNSSPISNYRRSKSAIFISRSINYNINSLLPLHVGTHIIYLYISIGRALLTGSRNENNIGLPAAAPKKQESQQFV